MEIFLKRDAPQSYGTLGNLYIGEVWEAFTLERPSEGAGAVDIPAGTYPVILTWSNRFQRILPLVDKVPGRTGIRIHPGNTENDTEGCILLGHMRYKSSIGQSRVACEVFQTKLSSAILRGETATIMITDLGAA